MARKTDTSRVIRISGEHYEDVQRMKDATAKREGKKKITYDAFFDFVLPIARALFEGREGYRVGERVFDDLAEARGEAILAAKRTGGEPVWPEIFVRIGRDPGPRKAA